MSLSTLAHSTASSAASTSSSFPALIKSITQSILSSQGAVGSSQIATAVADSNNNGLAESIAVYVGNHQTIQQIISSLRSFLSSSPLFASHSSLLALLHRLQHRLSSLLSYLSHQSSVLSDHSRLYRSFLSLFSLLQWCLSPSLVVSLVFRHLVALILLYILYGLGRLIWSNVKLGWKNVWEDAACLIGSEYHTAHREWSEKLERATSYGDWVHAAKQLDELEGRSDWKQIAASPHYNYHRISHNLSILTHLISSHQSPNADPQALMRYLRSRLLRNLGDLTNKHLYSHLRHGTKSLIESYQTQVIRALDLVCNDPFIPRAVKLAFFRETRHSYGRSALLLSGGAALGLYHLGVITALHEMNQLPQILSGSSVGAIFVALLATRFDHEINHLCEPESGIRFDEFPAPTGSLSRKFKRFLTQGVLMDVSILSKLVRDHIGDYTFAEAYDKFGRICNITVTPTSAHVQPMLLNYLTSPNVLIWSAAVASCAIPGVYSSVPLMAKNTMGEIVEYYADGMRFMDGSVKLDLPMERLRELFNVNHFIVSQINPHVIPFLFSGESYSRASFLQRLVRYLAREVQQLTTNLIGLTGVGRIEWKLLKVFRLLEWVSLLSSQDYRGGKQDITLLPPVSLSDYLYVLTNPDTIRLTKCVESARRYTWKYGALIQGHCEIEFELDKCVRKLRGEVMENAVAAAVAQGNAANVHVNTAANTLASNSLQQPSLLSNSQGNSPLQSSLRLPAHSRTNSIVETFSSLPPSIARFPSLTINPLASPQFASRQLNLPRTSSLGVSTGPPVIAGGAPSSSIPPTVSGGSRPMQQLGQQFQNPPPPMSVGQSASQPIHYPMQPQLQYHYSAAAAPHSHPVNPHPTHQFFTPHLSPMIPFAQSSQLPHQFAQQQQQQSQQQQLYQNPYQHPSQFQQNNGGNSFASSPPYTYSDARRRSSQTSSSNSSSDSTNANVSLTVPRLSVTEVSPTVSPTGSHSSTSSTSSMSSPKNVLVLSQMAGANATNGPALTPSNRSRAGAPPTHPFRSSILHHHTNSLSTVVPANLSPPQTSVASTSPIRSHSPSSTASNLSSSTSAAVAPTTVVMPISMKAPAVFEGEDDESDEEMDDSPTAQKQRAIVLAGEQNVSPLRRLNSASRSSSISQHLHTLLTLPSAAAPVIRETSAENFEIEGAVGKKVLSEPNSSASSHCEESGSIGSMRNSPLSWDGHGKESTESSGIQSDRDSDHETTVTNNKPRGSQVNPASPHTVNSSALSDTDVYDEDDTVEKAKSKAVHLLDESSRIRSFCPFDMPRANYTMRSTSEGSVEGGVNSTSVKSAKPTFDAAGIPVAISPSSTSATFSSPQMILRKSTSRSLLDRVSSA